MKQHKIDEEKKYLLLQEPLFMQIRFNIKTNNAT